MHPFRTILCCCVLSAAPAFAAEGDKVVRFPSPKGDLVLLVVQRSAGADTVKLEGVSGKEFLTFAVDDELKEGEVKDGTVQWSPNSDGVAFAAGNKSILQTFAFVRTKEEWKPLKLPEPGGEGKVWANHHVQPAKWQGKQLVLTITGPHDGKAGTETYAGTMTVAVDPESGVAKKVEENIAVEKNTESR
ncbi:hypothetical protein [Luteolibacter luteus]|uniref:Uncharacterized protein n=1 Tax=Luteolibacter luteus TaxID=2728835 RepID=A0A858RCN8_9BACT|nr:hypothetical protein [Luteolibacter luteus]QJE94492.1 hypothetical protein HHL09_01375 [Luteolibacter luteus]